MTELICTISEDILNKKIGVTVVDLDRSENDVLFAENVYHNNFFNGQSTQRKYRNLATKAYD